MAIKVDILAGNSEFAISEFRRYINQEGIPAKYKASRYFVSKSEEKKRKTKLSLARSRKRRRLQRLAEE